ncbi:hypothetical protein DFJ77DRAFT_328632 [Powellomyces hirtus]|nr:hypothetical protein DFJ77DRAFT_328632 [Powellomyces hirtus]
MGILVTEMSRNNETSQTHGPGPMLLPPELLYQIALLTPLATISTFRRTSKQLLRLLPSGDELLKREYDALLKKYAMHEALGRSLVRAYRFERCAPEIGQKAHMRLIRMLVEGGAHWGKAFSHVWRPRDGRDSAYRKQVFDEELILRLACGDDQDHADRMLEQYGQAPDDSTKYGIWLWEIQMAVIKRWCKTFGEVNDLQVIRSFVPVLGVFEVAAVARCAEIVKDAEDIWTEWR